MGTIEPLEPRLWFRAIRQLQSRSMVLLPEHEERSLRHAFHLCQLTPTPLRGMIQPALSELEIERLLEDGAYDDAAAGLVGAPMTLLIQRIENKLFDIRVGVPGQESPTRLETMRIAAGVVAAWSLCLLNLERPPGEAASWQSGRGASSAHSGQYQRPS